MIEYRCPNDGALIFKAEAPVSAGIEHKCRRCSQIVRPEPVEGEVLHRTYRCSGCGREQHCERPKDERSYCIVCGTPSLEIIDEVRPAVQTPKRETVRR